MKHENVDLGLHSHHHACIDVFSIRTRRLNLAMYQVGLAKCSNHFSISGTTARLSIKKLVVDALLDGSESRLAAVPLPHIDVDSITCGTSLNLAISLRGTEGMLRAMRLWVHIIYA